MLLAKALHQTYLEDLLYKEARSFLLPRCSIHVLQEFRQALRFTLVQLVSECLERFLVEANMNGYPLFMPHDEHRSMMEGHLRTMVFVRPLTMSRK